VYTVRDMDGIQVGLVRRTDNLREAQRAAVRELLLQHEYHRKLFGTHSTWHIGKRSLEKLKRLAALYALEG
jgi:hypothetical protein